jgi:hypothetical protein
MPRPHEATAQAIDNGIDDTIKPEPDDVWKQRPITATRRVVSACRKKKPARAGFLLLRSDQWFTETAPT